MIIYDLEFKMQLHIQLKTAQKILLNKCASVQSVFEKKQMIIITARVKTVIFNAPSLKPAENMNQNFPRRK